MPVAAQVIRHAATRPDRVAVSGPYGEITYAELTRRMHRTAAHLAAGLPQTGPHGSVGKTTAHLAAGLHPSDPHGAGSGRAAGGHPQVGARGAGPGWVVGICLEDPVEQVVAVLAADLVGATPLLYEAALREGVPADLFVETLPAGGPDSFAGVEPSPHDLAWACFSSGSTGRPRAVVRTRASWTGSFEPLSELTGIGADDVVLVPGALVSSLYGFAAMHALAVGATVLAPGRWAAGALPELLRRATAVHLVPHLLPRLLDALPERAPLRVAVVGGAALSSEVRERAREVGVRVVAYYGATELSFVAVDDDGGGLRPFPGVEIEVRPPRGEVWARSPWLAEGYLGGVAGPLKIEDKWMSVGDLADPYTPGEPLRLRGRGDGAIQTGGATVVPEDVEEVLRRVPGVGDVVVVGTPHPGLGTVVTAVVEAGAGALPSKADLEAAARAGLAAAQRPRRWYAITRMPRTPTGKPARAQLAARLTTPDPELRRLR